MYQLTASPLDGLKLGADYISAENETGTVAQSYEAGGWYANYAIGNFKLDMVKDTSSRYWRQSKRWCSQL